MAALRLRDGRSHPHRLLDGAPEDPRHGCLSSSPRRHRVDLHDRDAHGHDDFDRGAARAVEDRGHLPHGLGRHDDFRLVPLPPLHGPRDGDRGSAAARGWDRRGDDDAGRRGQSGLRHGIRVCDFDVLHSGLRGVSPHGRRAQEGKREAPRALPQRRREGRPGRGRSRNRRSDEGSGTPSGHFEHPRIVEYADLPLHQGGHRGVDRLHARKVHRDFGRHLGAHRGRRALPRRLP